MSRAAVPVVGVLVVLGLTVTAATAVGVMVAAEPTEPAPVATFEITAVAEDETIKITHAGGDELDVERLQIELSIDGEPLEKQPPVPFFAADGFQGGPTGPFNTASSNQWRVGETASVQLAATNSPTLTAGRTVRVEISTDTATIADVESQAR